ncbi:hypothetical protein BJY01DRAFT_256128, partial [Aspergillus pseudoustus]
MKKPSKRTAVALLTLFPLQVAGQIRVRFNPSNIRELVDSDFPALIVDSEAQSSSGGFGGANFTVSAPEGSYLEGNYYKYQYTRTVSHLGERVVNTGITTSEDNPGPITLSITGLEEGEHTLLTWHNLWDRSDGPAEVSVAVGDQAVASGIVQSSRIDNIWEAATSYITFSVGSPEETIEIVYTPSGGDGRVYLNGIEIDTPAIENQVSFPTPAHRDERLDPTDGTSIVALWRAPTGIKTPLYNVYFSRNNDNFTAVGQGLNKTQIELTGLNQLDTYWRVDVVDGETVYSGRPFMFRLAHLAFPGAEGYG